MERMDEATTAGEAHEPRTAARLSVRRIGRWTYIHGSFLLAYAVWLVLASPGPIALFALAAAGLVSFAALTAALLRSEAAPAGGGAPGSAGEPARPMRTPADLVTLSRAVVGSLALLVLWGMQAEQTRLVLLLALLGLAALTDLADGALARARGASPVGATLDMETDAHFIFLLSVLLYQGSDYGAWILLIGAIRYLFLFPFAFLRGSPDFPPAFRVLAKSVCVVAVVTLLLALSTLVPAALHRALNLASLGLLLVSFLGESAYRIRATRSRQDDATG
jgi:phosphatidylglycerophosphate synthase